MKAPLWTYFRYSLFALCTSCFTQFYWHDSWLLCIPLIFAQLFQRCLIRVLNIDLWRTYLLYVRETKASLQNYQEKMAQAYDFALDKMGLDIQSHTIWSDYIKFLKGVEAAGTFAENQKIAAIRKVRFSCPCNMLNIYILGLSTSCHQPHD